MFRDRTQRQFAPLASQDFKAGSLTTFRLPETGLGGRLYLTVKGTLSVDVGTGTAALSALGIRNLISRISVRLNDGSILYEMEGFNTKIPTGLQNGFDPDITTISRNYSTTTPYTAPAAGAALATQNYPVLFDVEIPFMNNDKDMLGLILLQNGTTQATVEIQWNSVTSPSDLNAAVKVTGNASATFTGNVNPTLEFYSLPTAANQKELLNIIAPNIGWMNQWKSEYETITSTAPLMKKLDRGSIYTKIMHRFIVNGQLNSTAVDNFRILMKGTETPLSISRDLQLYLQRRNYGFDLEAGLFVHDMDRSFGIEEFGDMRDYIDSRQLTELTSEVRYDPSTSIGNDSFVYTIVHKLTPVNL